ncbi:hypothetical protein, partial [Paraburkholderia antibiotica]|uniref:hypothetical protein n=1 Tax=Paraburkholderia antibiotica TaxID=2728839 RepID=UPI0019808B42
GKRTFLRFEQNGDRGPGVFAATTTRAANCAMRRKRVVQTFLSGMPSRLAVTFFAMPTRALVKVGHYRAATRECIAA